MALVRHRHIRFFFMKKIGMTKVSARWVPKQLREDKGIQSDHNLLTMKKIVFELYCHGDEMWAHYAEPETKAHSEQWK